MPPSNLLEAGYAAALGRAVYCFASLEWTAVNCCERLQPGCMDDLSERTAGRIADTLIHLIKRLPVSAEHKALHEAARDFEALVGTRNNLVHAKPGRTAEGTEALFRHGDQWLLEELERVADRFTDCSRKLDQALAALLAGR